MTKGILFLLWCGPAVALAQPLLQAVDVEGLGDEHRSNVLALMRLAALVGREDVREAQLRWLFAGAEDDIARALQPYGYYRPDIQSSLDPVGDAFRARFVVDPGPAVTVRELLLDMQGEAAVEADVQAALADFRPRRGARFDHRHYEASKSAVERRLAALGYFDSQRTQARVRVHADLDKADIDLAWASGARHRFGTLRFEGAQFPDAFMVPFARFEQGDPFDAGKLLAMQQALLNADYFGMVDVRVHTEEAKDLEVPVEVVLAPGARNIYSAGLILGTDSGLGVRGGVEWRWVNARGHKAEVQGEVSQRRNALGALYRIPVPGDLASWYNVGLNVREETTDTSESEAAQLKVERTFRFKGWDASASMNAQRERFTVADARGIATLIYPQLRVARVVADDRVVPSRGFSLSGEVRVGNESLGSDFDFAQFRVDGKYVMSLGDANRLLLRGTLGRTFTDRFESLPPSLRFFAGGDISVRGYDYQALGPRTDDGQVLGGKNLMVASVEFERMFSERWGGAAFIDAGNAFGRDFDAAVGAGLGVRWRSPIGPLRLDVARGFDEPKGFRLHLVLGPDL
ncbi:MAG TPA: autotransporter assembly complex family protein [Xanthomonadaceae bacterium]|nr:autotransporter assembly complex family protein [Xanthomonadaceae bacterium]